MACTAWLSVKLCFRTKNRRIDYWNNERGVLKSGNQRAKATVNVSIYNYGELIITGKSCFRKEI